MTNQRREYLKAAGALGAMAMLPNIGLAAHHKGHLKDTADGLLQASVNAGDVPGVVAMATNRQGLIYEGAFGSRQAGANVPMTLDTVMWIASMTKALTGAAASGLPCRLSMNDRQKERICPRAKHWVIPA